MNTAIDMHLQAYKNKKLYIVIWGSYGLIIREADWLTESCGFHSQYSQEMTKVTFR